MGLKSTAALDDLFLSTPSARRATQQFIAWADSKPFLSTPSARRATQQRATATSNRRNFYPRPPRGGRRADLSALSDEELFLSTPSARRATRNFAGLILFGDISIHALREEGDCFTVFFTVGPQYFYPRPPRGGRRGHPHAQGADRKFLSTPSARRATWQRPKNLGRAKKFLSTPSARRATGHPHAQGADRKFLSTPSARRATCARKEMLKMAIISIHALREEGDRERRRRDYRHRHFYPRPPRGGRPRLIGAVPITTCISIHALREEGDAQNL